MKNAYIQRRDNDSKMIKLGDEVKVLDLTTGKEVIGKIVYEDNKVFVKAEFGNIYVWNDNDIKILFREK